MRHTVNAAVSTMIEQGDGGAIVPAGSAASVTGINDLAGYAASKHAVLCIARTLAKELGRYQIRVNAVLPGNCNTRCSTTRTSASSTCRALPSRRTRSSTTAPPR